MNWAKIVATSSFCIFVLFLWINSYFEIMNWNIVKRDWAYCPIVIELCDCELILVNKKSKIVISTSIFKCSELSCQNLLMKEVFDSIESLTNKKCIYIYIHLNFILLNDGYVVIFTNEFSPTTIRIWIRINPKCHLARGFFLII